MKGAYRIAAIAVAVALSGCSWFRNKPAEPSAKPPPSPAAVPLIRAACPNSAEVWAKSGFPRQAIVKGLVDGQVTVKFRVDGQKMDVLEVTASDPIFAEAASQVVLRYQCSVPQPVVFEMAFWYRRG